MKKKILLFLLALFLFCIDTVQAQLDISMRNTDPQIPTWQTYEFMRYGKIGASLYTGTVNYSIPFYTYKDNDFELPISLDYASNGFKANSRSGPLGHDWILNVGGVITREIRGIPDDVPEFVQSPASPSTGFDLFGFARIYSDCMSESAMQLQFFIDQYKRPIFYNQFNSSHYELDPDIYNFNFMGYSGSFYLWYDGKIKIFNATGASKGVKIQYNYSSGSFVDSIIITTPDGYKYVFIKNEYTISETNGVKKKTVLTWKLYTISAPNERLIKLYYGADMPQTQYIPQTNYYFMTCAYSDEYNTISNHLVLNTQSIYSSRLDSIIITGGTKVRFSYIDSLTQEKYISSNQIKAVSGYTGLVKKITIVRNDTLIKECALFYKYPTLLSSGAVGNKTPFLGSAQISGEGSYAFNYYGLTNRYFPYLGSFSFDHWGYYNGKNDALSPIDMTNYLSNDSEYNETLSTTIKNPDANFSIIGMLERISYPTGGFSELYYEPHTYSAKVVRNSQNAFKPILTQTGNEVTGGIRINKVVNYDSSGIKSDSLSYIYVGSNGLSSGIQINAPRYGVKYSAFDNQNVEKYVDYYSSSNNIYDYTGTHIEYSCVKEKKSDNSYIDYYFTNSLNYPDTLYEASNLIPVPSYMSNSNLYTYAYFTVNSYPQSLANILTPITSYQHKRGHLWHKETRDVNGLLLKDEITYYEFPVVSQVYTPKVVGEAYMSSCFKAVDHQIASTSVSDYEVTHQINKRTSFVYNSKGQTTSTRSTTSVGDSLITQYAYVTDLSPAPISGIYKNMLDNNVINYPIQEKVYLKKGGTLKQISSKRYTYINPNAGNLCLVRPSMIENWNQDDTWTVALKYNVYDSMGNVLETEDSKGSHTAFLWSYGGQYLITKVENATYSAANTALSSVGLVSGSALSSMSAPDAAVINKLRQLDSNLPASSVYIYKYSPLVGLLENVAPNGLSSYFDYDGWGRLKSIEDSNHKQTNLYKYNLSTMKPLTAGFSSSSSYVVGTTNSFTASASGGSGNYEYLWTLKNAAGNVLYNSTTSPSTVSITFSQLGTMSLTCKVIDTVTQEEVDCVKTFTVTTAPIQFTNVSETHDVSSGYHYIEGYITCTEATTIEFYLDCRAPQSKLYIGNSSYSFTGHKVESLTKTLSAGSTLVKIVITNAVAEVEASLCISSATQPIGSNSCLYLYSD
ncbi:hypothetical protein [uncultured Bacteroides sp.]|uniref:hypothetical protein n=1 Tax=uncultured Bacteroides sp. TaxID=162156 RepID=UPI002AA865B1|nr:hypothetical protein [uncultured Bacteroides sp.]